MVEDLSLSRRMMLARMLGTSGAVLLPRWLSAAPAGASSSPKICAFVKFLQSLSYEELADTIATLGFNGIEATIRKGGQIEPERAEDELPKLVDALKQRGLEITVMAADINRADDPLTHKVLRTAASLGVQRYRMKYYRYDLSQPIRPQLERLRPVLKDLADLNRELGVSAVYQNHAGARYVGASLWDLIGLLDELNIAPSEIGVAFDIRHATVEGGTVWRLYWNLVQPHLGCVYVKDFHWNGRDVENVPLGDGLVDPGFFSLLNKSGYDGPISLHVEYLPDQGLAENIAALRSDFDMLRTLLSGDNHWPD